MDENTEILKGSDADTERVPCLLAFLPRSPPDSVLTAVTASTAISAKNELSGPRILELIAVLAAFTRFGLPRAARRGKSVGRVRDKTVSVWNVVVHERTQAIGWDVGEFVLAWIGSRVYMSRQHASGLRKRVGDECMGVLRSGWCKVHTACVQELGKKQYRPMVVDVVRV